MEEGINKSPAATATTPEPENQNRKNKKSPAKRWLKKSGRFMKWFAIVFTAVVLLLLICRDIIIKSCITGIGSLIAGVEITVDEFDTSLDGKIKITNLSVANPQTFKEPHLLKFSSFYLDVDMASLFSSDIIIEELDINELQFTGEFLANGKFNVTELINHISDPSKEPEPPQDDTAAGKVFINKFSIRNSAIKICDPQHDMVISFKSIAGSTAAGAVQLTDLVITAPAGFRKPNIVTVARMQSDFDAEAIFSGDIAMKKLLIEGVRGYCEFKDNGSSNLMTAVNILPASENTAPEENSPAAADESAADSEEESTLPFSIDHFVIRDSFIALFDHRTGCDIKVPLEAEYKALSFNSPGSIADYLRENIAIFCDTLDNITHAPDLLKDSIKKTGDQTQNLLKDSVKKTGDFFKNSGSKIIDVFKFK